MLVENYGGIKVAQSKCSTYYTLRDMDLRGGILGVAKELYK
jgi:hypothetical protein